MNAAVRLALILGALLYAWQSRAHGDADFWVCRRPDKTRRCFFAPLGM